MTIIGDIFGSINPFSSQENRETHQENLEKRATNLLHSAEESIAQTGLDTIKFVGSHLGFDLSKEMADYYQTGNGKTLVLSEEKLEKFNTIQKAENTNQNRILNS